MKTNHRGKEKLALFLEEVWSRGLIDAADRYIAASYTIRHDPGDSWDGMTLDREGYKDRVRRSRAPMPDQRFNLKEMPADGDAIAVSWL